MTGTSGLKHPFIPCLSVPPLPAGATVGSTYYGSRRQERVRLLPVCFWALPPIIPAAQHPIPPPHLPSVTPVTCHSSHAASFTVAAAAHFSRAVGPGFIFPTFSQRPHETTPGCEPPSSRVWLVSVSEGLPSVPGLLRGDSAS